MDKHTSLLAAMAVFLLQIGSVHAALNYQFTGTVDNIESGNLFGLSVSDTITASVIFDETALSGWTGSGWTGSILFGGTSGNTLSIPVGSVTFNTATLLAPAQLDLVSGEVSEFGIKAVNGLSTFNSDFAGLGTPGINFFASDSASALVDGSWNAGFTPVPVPAAAWLFGSGLIGLVGLARRNISS